MLSPSRGMHHGGERGLSLVLMSLVLASLLGIAGLVVDLGSWQVHASRTQQAADAAALAGVVRLPDGDVAAITRARAIAKDNGFDHADPDITVDVEALGDDSLEVVITEVGVPQYFTTLFRGPPTITRRATAQYVQPVPLGSPRNYLGTGNLLDGVVTGDGVENFWLSMSGSCTRREYGDRIAPRAMAIPGTSPYSCTPPTYGSLPNPERDADGYLFGVTVPDASGSTPVGIQMFDAPTCTQSGSNRSRAGDESLAPFDVSVTVRAGDDLDPTAGTPLATYVFDGSDDTGGHCGLPPAVGGECASTTALRSCWTTLATVSSPGTYYIQVQPVHADVDSRHDNFSLRAKSGATFTPCTSDVNSLSPSPGYSATCAQVYGVEHLPVFANLSSADPVFFLASIDDRHSSKTMEVTLYDAAEGADGIRLLDPNGDAATFTWEVLCADGNSGSPSCTGETDPTGGRSGGATTLLPVAGTGNKTFSNNVQNGKYSDRLVRLRVQLPSDIAAAHGGRTWWKISYEGSFSGDRTTWSVKLLGDPVRLVPNSPTTTTAPPGP